MTGLNLGKLFGIPLRINFSFLLLMLLFALFQGVSGVILLGLTFFSVLLHELGHALVARRRGVPILGIDLHFFGGAAKLGRMPRSPREEILIAAAGPAVSFSLAAVGFVLFNFSRTPFILHFALINLLLGGFNLLPALPMDGGRIFRALLSKRLGRMKATRVSVRVAKVISVGLALLALWNGNLFLTGLAIMLWFLADAELRATILWDQMTSEDGTRVSEQSVDVLDRFGNPIRLAKTRPRQQQGGTSGFVEVRWDSSGWR